MKLGILGATGWLGGALTERLVAGGWPEADLVLANRSGPRGAAGAHWATAAEVARADVVVIAVRPGDFPVPSFVAALEAPLVISFMAFWKLRKLRLVAPRARLVRAMPNSGAPSGTSYTPWMGEVGPEDAGLVTRVLGALGEVVRLESEEQLDYMGALPGSGLAYPALLAQAMLAHARSFGLPEAVAERAVEAVIVEAAQGLKGRMGELGDILELYRGYRGMTAAGIDAAEEGLSKAIRAALQAAYETTVEFER